MGAECGPLQAAWLYTTATSELRAHRIPGKVAAGTFTKAGSYADGYLHQLIGTLHTRPAVISFHDYIDPTANSTAVAHDFAVRLYRKFGKRFELWITESGVYLGEWAPLPPEGGSSRAHGCEFGTNRAQGLQGLGRCINGNQRAQAAGAASFKYRLAQRGSYRGVRITELFWYQYRALRAHRDAPGPMGLRSARRTRRPARQLLRTHRQHGLHGQPAPQSLNCSAMCATSLSCE